MKVSPVLAAGAMVATFVAGLGGSAQAASTPPTVSSVTCAGSSFCLAIGSYSKPGHPDIPLLEEWTGRTWRIIPDPRGYLSTITCGGPSFCLAAVYPLKGPERVIRWNGRSWQSFTPQPPSLYPLDCASPTFCVTINSPSYTSGVVDWTGKSWQAMPDQSGNCAGPDCSFDNLSCVSATFCMASGSYCTDGNCDSTAYFNTFWNGSLWRDNPGTPFFGTVACAGRGFCLDLALPAKAAVTNDWGTTWHAASAGLAAACRRLGDCAQPSRLACGSARFCVALVPFTSPTASLTWNGATWQIARLALVSGHRPKLIGLSCGSARNCVAIGSYQLTPRSFPQPIAEHWNGSTWRVTKLANP